MVAAAAALFLKLWISLFVVFMLVNSLETVGLVVFVVLTPMADIP